MDKMEEFISLGSVAPKASLYEGAEAVALLLCRECVPELAGTGLPKDLQAAVLYAVDKDVTVTDKGKVTELVLPRGDRFVRLVLAGAGKGRECTPTNLRRAAGNAVRILVRHGVTNAIVAGPVLLHPARNHYLKAVVEGLLLGSYRFDKYKSDKKTPNPLSISIVNGVDGALGALSQGMITAYAIGHARDLANEPGNVINPEVLAEEAEEVAEKYGLDVEVLTEREMAQKGMNAILAVGAGSIHPPRLVTLTYRGAGDAPFLAFVGKGITFDSGGISLKPGVGMGEMKDDMSGAAAVLGAMQAIASLQMKVNVLGILACAENMPSGSAQRPGDIVTAANGKTIEVVNTDAEGRMVLADAVWYAGEKGATEVVDIATLTGAVIIALGEDISGIVANDDNLAMAVKLAGHRAGEEWWQLPLLENADELLASSCADYKNSAGRPAGTITGGAFIGHFVKPGLPWAHLDIGGTSTAKKTHGHLVEGCTAFGTATLIEYAKSRQVLP